MINSNKIYSKCNFPINTPRPETLPALSLKSIDYMSVGTPHINSSIGDIWDLMDRYNIYININKNKISEAIEQLIKL